MLNEQIHAYKAQISGLENKTGANWAIAIIAILAGLILGYLLRGH